MINKIVIFNSSINRFTTRKMLIPYSVSVGINKLLVIGYNVEAHNQKIVFFHHDTSSTLSGQNSIISLHYSISNDANSDNVIIRKNEND